MGIGKLLAGLLAILLLGGLLVGGCAYSGYNRAVRLDEDVKGAWAQVETQLQRRYDLIPNLVNAVKGIVGHEQEVFLGIAKAREAYFQSKTDAKPVAERAQAASAYESALSRLLVLQERYPELRSNESFLKLQDEIAGAENRIGVERGRYNDRVRELNTFARSLLGRLYTSLAGVERAEYFETSEGAKTAPKVDFSPPATTG